MSPDNSTLVVKSVEKDESSGLTGRKTTSAKPQEPTLKCPRCDSPNTKFCYYNNYSLTQPRHFCKTCRRYWTRGGTLRNVPIGGGCRKSKKMKASSSRISGESRDSIGSSDIGGLKFFQGISPAMDFQLGGLSFPRLDYPNTDLFNQFSFGDKSKNSTSAIASNPCFSLDPSGSSPMMGLNLPLFSSFKQGASTLSLQEMGCGSLNVHSSLATSIESLSSINQDLHWKLQQQRLAMLYVEENQKENCVSSANLEPQNQKHEALLFQNLEIAKQEASGVGSSTKEGTGANLSTEWFFDNSYTPVTPTPPNGNGNIANENTSNWNGIQACWSNLNQYSSLP